jgi:hypothetical protein
MSVSYAANYGLLNFNIFYCDFFFLECPYLQIKQLLSFKTIAFCQVLCSMLHISVRISR